MEDYEVRQALAIIKDRVNEITNDPNWKQNITTEWNQANEEEAAARQARREKRASNHETSSQVSYGKHKSFPIYTSYKCSRFLKIKSFAKKLSVKSLGGARKRSGREAGMELINDVGA